MAECGIRGYTDHPLISFLICRIGAAHIWSLLVRQQPHISLRRRGLRRGVGLVVEN
jgi:hypothetical protein